MSELNEAELTVSEKLEILEARNRKRASRQGAPLERAVQPMFGNVEHLANKGVAVPTAHAAVFHAVVWSQGRSIMIAEDGGAPRHLSSDDPLFANYEPRAPKRVLFSDEKTYSRAAARLGGLARARLEFSASLPMSSLHVVMTKALAHSWWLPAEFDAADIGDWGKAFGIGGHPRKMIATIFERHLWSGAPWPMVTNIAKREAWGLSAAQYRVLSAACGAFKDSEKVTDQYEAITLLDTGLIETNIITKQATIIDVTSLVTAANYVGEVESGTVSSKIDSGLLLARIDDEGRLRPTVMTLAGLEVGVDGVRVSLASRRTKGSLTRGRYLVVKEPFMGASNASSSRWGKVASRETERTRRTVPADIALAGAPTD